MKILDFHSVVEAPEVPWSMHVQALSLSLVKTLASPFKVPSQAVIQLQGPIIYWTLPTLCLAFASAWDRPYGILNPLHLILSQSSWDTWFSIMSSLLPSLSMIGGQMSLLSPLQCPIFPFTTAALPQFLVLLFQKTKTSPRVEIPHLIYPCRPRPTTSLAHSQGLANHHGNGNQVQMKVYFSHINQGQIHQQKTPKL